jgi:hypothetical protein
MIVTAVGMAIFFMLQPAAATQLQLPGRCLMQAEGLLPTSAGCTALDGGPEVVPGWLVCSGAAFRRFKSNLRKVCALQVTSSTHQKQACLPEPMLLRAYMREDREQDHQGLRVLL